MKNKLLLVGFIFILSVSIISLTFSGEMFEGNVVKTVDEYTLYVYRMKGKNSHSMYLKKGDVLDVYFRKDGGDLSLTIKDEDGENIYSGDGTVVNEFTIDIEKTGRYLFEVKSKDAKGAISIKKK